MATHSSTFTWETPWTEETGGLQFIGSQRVGQDLVTKHQQRGVIRRDEGYMKETRTLIPAWRGGDQGLEGLQDAAWGWGSGTWGGHKEARGSEATRTECRRSQSPTSCWDLVLVCEKLSWQHRWGDTGVGPARAQDLSLGSGRGSLKPSVSVGGGYLFALACLQPPPRGSYILQS